MRAGALGGEQARRPAHRRLLRHLLIGPLERRRHRLGRGRGRGGRRGGRQRHDTARGAGDPARRRRCGPDARVRPSSQSTGRSDAPAAVAAVARLAGRRTHQTRRPAAAGRRPASRGRPFCAPQRRVLLELEPVVFLRVLLSATSSVLVVRARPASSAACVAAAAAAAGYSTARNGFGHVGRWPVRIVSEVPCQNGLSETRGGHFRVLPRLSSSQQAHHPSSWAARGALVLLRGGVRPVAAHTERGVSMGMARRTAAGMAGCGERMDAPRLPRPSPRADGRWRRRRIHTAMGRSVRAVRAPQMHGMGGPWPGDGRLADGRGDRRAAAMGSLGPRSLPR